MRGHEIQRFLSADNGWAPRTYESLDLSRAPAQYRLGNTTDIVPEGYQYPDIAAGNALEAASGFRESFWGLS